MIDATKITNYNATKSELEKHVCFWILAAGKSGVVAARQLEKLDEELREDIKRNFGSCPRSIFARLRAFEKGWKPLAENYLAHLMKINGIGCYNQKAGYLLEVARSGLNLRTCSVDDLEKCKGIGRKSSRCFVIHTRRKAWYAGLDTHALKFLRDNGYPEAPKITPSSKVSYENWEKKFLDFVPSGMTAGEFDLTNWNNYRV